MILQNFEGRDASTRSRLVLAFEPDRVHVDRIPDIDSVQFSVNNAPYPVPLKSGDKPGAASTAWVTTPGDRYDDNDDDVAAAATHGSRAHHAGAEQRAVPTSGPATTARRLRPSPAAGEEALAAVEQHRSTTLGSRPPRSGTRRPCRPASATISPKAPSCTASTAAMPKPRGQHPVERRRRTTALHVTEDRDLRVR